MGKKQTKEEVQKRLNDMGKEIDIIGEYRNTHEKCLCKCRKDKYEWMGRVHDLLGKHDCPKCSKHDRLTNESVDKQLEGRNIKRLDDVNGNKLPIRWQCHIDDYIWSASPNNVLINLTGCPRCVGHEPLTNESVDKRLEGRKITRLDDVNSGMNKIRWKCEVEGNIWLATLGSVLNGLTGCPKCAGSEKLTNASVDKRLEGRNIKRLDDVNGNKLPIRWKCLFCNDSIWTTSPQNVLIRLSGCPICHSISKRNDFIADYLKVNGFTFIREARFTTCRYKKELPFDFFIPSKRVLIEADGPQHFEYIKHFHKRTPFNVQLEKDYIKTQWAKRNKYILIRLSHDQPEEEILASLANIRFYKDC